MTEHNSGTDQTVDRDESVAIVETGPTRINEEGKACPQCGGEMEYGIIVTSGTEHATTEYMGWSCTSCAVEGVFCSDCEGVHHPDEMCAAREQRLTEETTEELGGVVRLPGGRSEVDIEECIDVEENGATYVDEGGCPECGSDLEISLHRNGEFAEPPVMGPEWEACAVVCERFPDGCSHREP